ncbi:MAG: DUF3109 family protein [Chitinophagaceae bacterium]|nr:DUF3109 family protein [Chitinophagaceae bacterium]
MIAIGNVLVSDEVVEEQFVCDLDKCKGGCCEDGDAGAPLEKDELAELNSVYEIVKPYLTSSGISAIEKQGRYVYDREFGWVTPTIKGKMCAYGHKDKKGIIKCGIEEAYNDGKIDWKKPISCHLYPIRISKTKGYEMVNYEPRESLCNPACVLGQKLKVPTYVFLKESITRKYGEEFYDVLTEAAKAHYETPKTGEL